MLIFDSVQATRQRHKRNNNEDFEIDSCVFISVSLILTKISKLATEEARNDALTD
jgi:hypothetical protein